MKLISSFRFNISKNLLAVLIIILGLGGVSVASDKPAGEKSDLELLLMDRLSNCANEIKQKNDSILQLDKNITSQLEPIGKSIHNMDSTFQSICETSNEIKQNSDTITQILCSDRIDPPFDSNRLRYLITLALAIVGVYMGIITLITSMPDKDFADYILSSEFIFFSLIKIRETLLICLWMCSLLTSLCVAFQIFAKIIPSWLYLTTVFFWIVSSFMIGISLSIHLLTHAARNAMRNNLPT